jgi:hypothetical protein
MIVVGVGLQSISFGSVPALAVGGAGSISATGGASTNAVTFTSTSPTICSVSGSTVTALKAGSCVIAANQAGNANYSAAPQATLAIVVGVGVQSISFGSVPALAVGGSGFISATGGASTNAVTFTSTSPTICFVSGSAVAALTVGSCVIAANQAGDANYSAAPQATQTIVVGIGVQSISFGSVPTLAVGGAGSIFAIGGASANAVTFTSTSPAICTVSGNTVSALKAGSCVIAANQAGDANYSAAPQATQTITVSLTKTSLTLLKGWNLLGNATDQPLTVSAAFSDTSVVTTVWKWDATALGWQFYTPTMSDADLRTYTASKGYGALAVINSGEGFWVNARNPATLIALSGAPFSLVTAQLVSGWNLVTTADNTTPEAFNLSLIDPLAAPPTAGVVPINLTTLWAWDNLLSKWYFYAPNLQARGGSVLTEYIVGKGYLDFTSTGKTLGAGVGFWVNKP